jgi:hypothetical protein
MDKQINNGNQQINHTRESFNEKVSKLSILGKSKKIKWDDKRRFRSI